MVNDPVEQAARNRRRSRPHSGAWSRTPAIPAHPRRVRQRYGELLRQQIANTMDGPVEVEEEVRELFAALAS